MFIILPVLLTQAKEVLATLKKTDEDMQHVADVIIPASYNFPKAGNILALSFVLFAGWYSGFDVSSSSYANFAFSGVISIFGGNMAGVTFMLDLMQIPADTFQLFLIFDNVFMLRFGALLSAVHMLVLTVLSVCAIQGLLVFKWSKLLRYIIISAVLTFSVVVGVRLFFENVVGADYQKGQQFIEMGPIYGSLPASVHEEYPPPLTLHTEQSRLMQIQERGFLRVGYTEGALPYAFENAKGQLTGLDIEMAHQLAGELDVRLEFVRVNRERMLTDLNDGYVDILMSSIAITTERASEILFSDTSMDQTIALVVRDHRRKEFNSRESLQSHRNLRLGSFNLPYYDNKIRNYLPDAELVYLNSPAEFFEQDNDLDGLILTAEAGSAWSLIHPQYTVAIPHPDILEVPIAYAMPQGEFEFAAYVNTWLKLKNKDQTISRLYDHWILGKNNERETPRWSVIKDVLHWID